MTTRFVICFSISPKSQIAMVNAFKLKHVTDPNDVSVPENCVAFILAESDQISNPDEISSAFYSIKINGQSFSSFSNSDQFHQVDSKFYFCGKLVSINGNKFIINEKTHSMIPCSSLSNVDYTVIDN